MSRSRRCCGGWTTTASAWANRHSSGWRLDHYGIRLGKPAASLMKYAERIFSRPAFIEALTPSEKVMRK